MDNQHTHIAQDILVAENIFLTIGQKEILHGATIRAGKGNITGLLGRNGAGKSTLLQSVFGTRSCMDCDVFINGTKTPAPYLHSGLINYLPQQPFLPRTMKIKNILRQYGLAITDLTTPFPELNEELDKTPAELAGGTERLISLLLLLLAPTRFTLLDEPFSHIMPLYTERLTGLLQQQKQYKGIIITDHQYQHILKVADHLYLMKEGAAIFIKDKNDLVLHGYLSSFAED